MGVFTNKVRISSKVRFKHNGRLYSRVLTNLDECPVGKVVTPDSPVGRAMLGKTAGDKFTVNTPDGPAEVEIIEVL